MATPRSIPIKAEKANLEIKQRKILHTPLAKIIDTLMIVTQQDKTVVENYFANQGNGFLFSRNSVLRHFFNDITKIPADLFNQNTDLLTILSAHDVDEEVDGIDFKKGDPTVIIAGVAKNAKRKIGEIENGTHKYNFKTAGDPADEYPPIEIIENLSIAEKDIKSILLSFK